MAYFSTCFKEPIIFVLVVT